METPSLVAQHWGHHFVSAGSLTTPLLFSGTWCRAVPVQAGSLSAFRMELEEEYSRAVIYGSLKVLDSECPELLIAGRAGGSAQPPSAVSFGSRVKSA